MHVAHPVFGTTPPDCLGRPSAHRSRCHYETIREGVTVPEYERMWMALLAAVKTAFQNFAPVRLILCDGSSTLPSRPRGWPSTFTFGASVPRFFRKELMKFSLVRETRMLMPLVAVAVVLLTTVTGAGSATAGAPSGTSVAAHERAAARFVGTQEKPFYASVPTVSEVKKLLKIRFYAPGAGRPYTVTMKNQKYKESKSGVIDSRGWVSLTFNPPNLGHAKVKVALPAFGQYRAERHFTKVSVLKTTVPNPDGVGVSVSWGKTTVAVGDKVVVHGRVTAGAFSNVQVSLIQLFAPIDGHRDVSDCSRPR